MAVIDTALNDAVIRYKQLLDAASDVATAKILSTLTAKERGTLYLSLQNEIAMLRERIQRHSKALFKGD